jgi:hypothetical protein
MLASKVKEAKQLALPFLHHAGPENHQQLK